MSCFTKIICSQYELKDVLRWELGLRNPEDLNISKLGAKSFILARNNFTDYFAEKFALSLKGDEYIRFIDLKKNQITV